MSVKMRQEVEHKIISAFVDSALAAGHRLSVSFERGYDRDDMRAFGSTDRQLILDVAFAGDDCHIFVHEATGPCANGGVLNAIGWVYCVFGNDGWDVISDYTTNLKSLMADAQKISDRYMD